MNIVTLKTNRSEYDIRDAARYSMTVGELIQELKYNFDEDDKIVFSNDNGYTYGYIDQDYIEMEEVESEEEEKEREYRENMEQVQEELSELQAKYENPSDEDDAMTDEEYRNEKASIFDYYGVTESEYENFNF